MQYTTKSKSRGLQVFARGKSDSNAHYNAPTEKPAQLEPEKRSSTPNAGTYVPNRQEIAEFARLSIPGAPLQPFGSPRASSQLRSFPRVESPAGQGYGSPGLQSREAHLHADEEHRDIFTGSQLGENFMNSGLSTPVIEAEAIVHRPAPVIKTEELLGQMDRDSHARETSSRPDPSTKADGHNFSMQPDGRLSVVSATHRYNPSHMRDGFFNNDVRYVTKAVKRSNPSYSFSGPIKSSGQERLPMRGVRINREQGIQPKPWAAPQAQSKARLVELEEDEKWDEEPVGRAPEAVLVHDSDDDVDVLNGFGGFGERLGHGEENKPSGLAVRSLRTETRQNRPGRSTAPKDKQKRRRSLDYDDKVLASMTFQDLQDEPFDLDPQLHGMNGHDSSASSLASRLQQFQEQAEREQRQFFAHMSMEEWEMSGDWFADQFSDIMRRLRAARQQKRKMIAAFEAEASQREEAIRSRTDAIDQKLEKMKQDGQRVVRDKNL